MRKRLVVQLGAFTLLCNISWAQATNSATIKGKVVNNKTHNPVTDIRVSIADQGVYTRTDGEGKFELNEIHYGKYQMIISGQGIIPDTVNVNAEDQLVDLKVIEVSPNEQNPSTADAEIPTITLADNANIDNSAEPSQAGSDLLVASRDPFVNTVVHTFGPLFFRPRGARNPNEIDIEGIKLNNVSNGILSWSTQLGDQNDVFRGREVRYGLEPSPYTFGSGNGSTYINAGADEQYKGTSVTYVSTNRLYRNKIMVTHNTGILKNGWAFSFSANRRWAEQGYIKGTDFDGYAYYAAASKTKGNNKFDILTFGVPIRYSRAQNVATQEAFDLAGTHFYNSGWGYQTSGGEQKVRASSHNNSFQPTTIFKFETTPSEKMRLTTSAGFQFGKEKIEGIDYYNASSPYGNYYKNMPSFYYNYLPPDSATGDGVKAAILANPDLLQLDWDRMYNANYSNYQTIQNVGGVAGATYSGNQSSYVLSNRVSDLLKGTLNLNYEYAHSKRGIFSAGLYGVFQKTQMYKQLSDLLGGDYFVNFNQFAAQQYVGNPNYNQNNLNDPNAVIKVGDIYGYNYYMSYNNERIWMQEVYSLGKINVFASGYLDNTQFRREGLMRNGLFANNSYGQSDLQSFMTYGVKGGASYRINRKMFVFANAAYMTSAPTPENTFVAPTMNNVVLGNIKTQKNLIAEGGLIVRSTKVSARMVGYINDAKDVSQIKRFYNDDPDYFTFVDYAMQNIESRSLGLEMMLSYKLLTDLEVIGVATVGQSFYTNNPSINVYVENDTTMHSKPTATYIKNYYLANGPQSAYTLGFNYRPRNYWHASVNFNYVDRNYVDINPNRRSVDAVDLIAKNSTTWNGILTQEKMPSAFTADIHVGKSFQLSRMNKTVKKTLGNRAILAVNLGVSNIFNNLNVKVRGMEQLRYDFANINPNKFANVYQYGFGTTYSLNVRLSF